VPDTLHEPLQALLPQLTRAASAAPTSIYLFANEENTEIKNLLAYTLSAALLQHVPSTLLVDCGFLDVGLSGVVPQKDSLGFLDLLLYGSSLGVITQETNGGVRVVGAGSFPVTKKMPFVESSFDEAARRLVNHSRCGIFCGPLYDDGGELHPLIGAVDVPILVRTTGPAADGVIDPIEEQIATRWDVELFSIRVTPTDQPARPAPTLRGPEAPAEAKESQPLFEEFEGQPAAREEAPPETKTPPQPAPPPTPEPVRPEVTTEPPPMVEFEEDAHDFPYPGSKKKYSSLLPKIATAAVALIVIVFVVWWFNQERTNGVDKGPPRQETAQTTQPGAETSVGQDDPAAADTSATPQGQSTTTPVAEGAEGSGSEASAATGETTTQETQQTTDVVETTPPPDQRQIDSSNILVMDDLESEWGGQYVVHISSFRESAKARIEISHLERRGFSVFIVFMNLGTKGTWYRVYAGPTDSREEARNIKKLLDDTPGVRFTRITQIAK